MTLNGSRTESANQAARRRSRFGQECGTCFTLLKGTRVRQLLFWSSADLYKRYFLNPDCKSALVTVRIGTAWQCAVNLACCIRYT